METKKRNAMNNLDKTTNEKEDAFYEDLKREAIEREANAITDTKQAQQTFDDMKRRESDRFNFNYHKIEKIIEEVHNKIDYEYLTINLKELKDLKDLINEYIRIVDNIKMIIERTHFEENKPLIDRNKTYYNRAKNCLKSSLKVVESRIKKREVKMDSSPKLKVEDFINYLKTERSKELLIFLKNEFPTGKNTEAAMMVFALLENKIMNEPTNMIDVINSIKAEWKSDFEPENFYKAMRSMTKRKTVDKKEYKAEVFAAVTKIKTFR